MDHSWLVVRDAARLMNVSPQRVRSLLASGALRGRKLGGLWFVDPRVVSQRDPRGGRPLSANNAWRVLRVLELLPQQQQHQQQQREDGEQELAGQHAVSGSPRPVVSLPFAASASDRSRLRSVLADVPDADALAQKVASRMDVCRMRAHPGVLGRLLGDGRVSVGGGRAVAAWGGGVAAGGIDRVYVAAADVEELVAKYRLSEDVEGNVEVVVIPEQVDEDLRPVPGEPVPLAVAWVDLLDDPDARVRGAARDWAAELPRSVVVADGRRR